MGAMITDHVVIPAQCHARADDLALLPGRRVQCPGNLALRPDPARLVLEHADAHHAAIELAPKFAIEVRHAGLLLTACTTRSFAHSTPT